MGCCNLGPGPMEQIQFQLNLASARANYLAPSPVSSLPGSMYSLPTRGEEFAGAPRYGLFSGPTARNGEYDSSMEMVRQGYLGRLSRISYFPNVSRG